MTTHRSPCTTAFVAVATLVVATALAACSSAPGPAAGCDQPYGLAEYEFFSALSSASGWDLANGALTLSGRAADGSAVELALSSPGR